MVVLFLAFMAFAVLILGAGFAHYLNDIPGEPWPEFNDPCEGDCPDTNGPDGACSVCGFITEDMPAVEKGGS